jgi:hypothetical protein
MTDHGTCDRCARVKRLTRDGLIVGHVYSLPVSRHAVPTVGAARVKRKCPGSGRLPRKVRP